MHQIVEREREFVWYCMFYHNDGEDARIIAMCKEVDTEDGKPLQCMPHGRNWWQGGVF